MKNRKPLDKITIMDYIARLLVTMSIRLAATRITVRP